MSLEVALAENTAALNRVAELLAASNSGREAALAAATALASGEAAKPTRQRRSDAKAAEPVAAAPAAVTLEEVTGAFANYLNVDDATERNDRKDKVRKVLEKFGATRASTLDPKHFAEARNMILALTKGENVPEIEEEGDDLI